MRTSDTRFRTYLKAFFSDLLTGMSGPLSVPFAVAALWVSSQTQKILYASLAVLCAMYASYGVWRKERSGASAKLAEKDSELTELHERITVLTAKQQKSPVRMTISVEGNPPSQILKIVANQAVAISRIEYMLSSEAMIAADEVSQYGKSLEVPINDGWILKVWNTPRSDRNNHDHSGPAKIGITVAADGDEGQQYILPVQMESVFQNSTAYRRVIGSKSFIERS